MLRTALALYAFRTRLRLRLIRQRAQAPLYGLPAERYVELSFAVEQAVAAPGASLLDVGSERSVLPAYFAAARRLRVTAMDICEYVFDQDAYARALGLDHQLVARFGDATQLPDTDNSLDLITCISTIEHLPGDGDSRCIRELGRVLRPGGRLILTTPIWHTTRDVYRNDSFYNQTFAGEPLFFERIYDPVSLRERLLVPSGLELLTDRTFFTTTHHPLLTFARALWRAPTRGISALLESLTYTDTWPRPDRDGAAYGVACLVLGKPA